MFRFLTLTVYYYIIFSPMFFYFLIQKMEPEFNRAPLYRHKAPPIVRKSIIVTSVQPSPHVLSVETYQLVSLHLIYIRFV